MMSELTRLRDEASRLLSTYEEHRDSSDEMLRRRAHVDLDRFLMENREVAALLMVQGLQDAFDKLVEAKAPPRRWYKRIFKGGQLHVDRNNTKNNRTIYAE